MPRFLPPDPIFGRGPSPFYLCNCPKCGFQQSYMLDDSVSVSSSDDASDAMKVVEKIPDKCPKCGAKWKKIHMPDFRKF